jgi:hypothetical protein
MLSFLLIPLLAGAQITSDVGTPAPQSKRGVAILASAVLPGSGQLMLGARNRGEALLWLDGSIWALWSGLSWYAGSREHDARLFAGREAGADIATNEAVYYKALERYDNSDQYNEDVRREARDLYPDDPSSQHTYYESHGYFGSSAWDWSSDSARYDYWRTRRSGRAAALKAQFTVGALLLNRIGSIIDCAFLAREAGITSRVEFRPTEDEPGIELCYRF